MKRVLQLYFQKGLLYSELHISRSERYKVMQNQLNIPSVLPLSKPGHFLQSFHKQGSYVMYIIFWPHGLLTFCDSFLIKFGQPENLISLYLSSLQSPSGNRVTFFPRQETELHSYGAKVQWVTRKNKLINSRVLCC